MKKNQISIRSSVAEYLTDVVFGGDQQDSIEMRYEDENIWLTQARSQQRLPRQKLKLNLASIELFKIGYLCPTSIDTCWNWKRIRRSIGKMVDSQSDGCLFLL